MELNIEEKLDIELINPFYDTEEKNFVEKLDRKEIKLWQAREQKLAKMNGLKMDNTVERDLEFCRNTDGILWLAPYHRFTIGAPMEAFYTHSVGKPVYTITYKKNVNHPFLKYVSSQIFTSSTDFIKWWKNEYK